MTPGWNATTNRTVVTIASNATLKDQTVAVVEGPPGAGLVGYWDFDEGSGQTAADKTGNGNNGALISGVQWASGKFGSGVLFDGVNDYVKVTKRNGFNFGSDFSFAMWIKPSSWKSEEPLFSNGLVRIYHRGDWAGDVVYFLIKITSTESLGDSAWDGWAGVKTSQPLSENKWCSIIGVKSGNMMTIYLNGVKSGEVDVLAGYSTDNSGPGDLFIGGDGSTNFNGIIDEVRIWNRALTATEVQNSYQYPPMLLPIGNITINEESSLRFTVVAMDAYNSNFSYSVSNLPPGASYSPLPTQEIFPPYSSGQKFFWTPSSDQTGTHTICFSVSNGVSSDSECITITVQRNCLLHASGCPSGLVCQGDGVCKENTYHLYGADAKPTSDPLGGGVGYRNVIDPKSANFTISTRSELMNALQNAVSGQIIYVIDSATINMTGDQNIAIPAGVTLASGRGINNALSALIYSDALNTYPLFITAGEGVRVTGLRLQGPDPERRTEQMIWLDAQGRYYDIPNSEGIRSSYSHLTVDNCELSGWSHAAIYLRTGSLDNYIHHNFIHYNQREGLGYGVVIDTGANALVEANVFDWNRHSIAGVRGSPGASYEARYNLVLGNANSHYFDMHGGNDIFDPTVPAGGYVNVHHNTFMESSQPAVEIRGVPTAGVWVYKNWALYDLNKFTTGEIFTQSLGNLPGHTPYEKMWVYDNWYGPNPPPILLTPFSPSKIGVSRGTRNWYLDSSGNGAWGLGDTAFSFGIAGDIPVTGDWNGDGTTEIGGVRGSHTWYVDYNGDGTWSGTPADRIYTLGQPGDAFVTGDWNGDGTTEIGVLRGSHTWYLDTNNNGAWDGTPTDKIMGLGQHGDTPVTGDWNGDGTTEIGVVRGSHTWYLDMNNNGAWDGTPMDKIMGLGQPGDIPVTGKW